MGREWGKKIRWDVRREDHNLSSFYSENRVIITSKLVVHRDGRLSSKVGQIGPKIGQIRDFSVQISVHIAHRAKFTEIWSEKVPELSNLGSNLTHFGAKPTIPDRHDEWRWQVPGCVCMCPLAISDKGQKSQPSRSRTRRGVREVDGKGEGGERRTTVDKLTISDSR